MELAIDPPHIYLETGVNNIELAHVERIDRMVSDAEFTYGGIKGCLIMCFKGKVFICDGIDPTTREPISQEILDGFRQKVDWAIIAGGR